MKRYTMSRRYKSRTKQWWNRLIAILGAVAGLSILTSIFGSDSLIVSFYKDEILFTPYNITGMIMIPLAAFGVWVGRKNGGVLFSIVSKTMIAISIIPWVKILFSWGTLSKYENPQVEKHATFFRKVSWIILGIVAILIACWFIERIKDAFDGPMKGSSKEERDPEGKVSCEKMEVPPEIIPTNMIGESSVENSNSILVSSEETITDNKTPQKENALMLESTPSTPWCVEMDQIAHRICPECGGGLKSRQNHTTKEWFMGCENYFTKKQCRYTIDYRDYKETVEFCTKYFKNE